MPSDKACKKCKIIVKKGNVCPSCGGQLTTNWKGFVVFFDKDKSEIAKKMDVSMPGKYALRLSK